MRPPTETVDDLIDVMTAARLHDINPETIRRWIRSGRLSARRQGRRFLVWRSDVEALATSRVRGWSLQTWAELAKAARHGTGSSGQRQTAADLVISDRRERSDPGPGHARR
jgi:excisionase family DNA binding protein